MAQLPGAKILRRSTRAWLIQYLDRELWIPVSFIESSSPLEVSDYILVTKGIAPDGTLDSPEKAKRRMMEKQLADRESRAAATYAIATRLDREAAEFRKKLGLLDQSTPFQIWRD
jgi:hypothetical protein